MKIVNLAVFFLCSIPFLAPATTIRVEIEFSIDEVIAVSGDAPSSGDQLSGWFEYEVPRLSDNIENLLSWEFYEIPSSGEAHVMGRSFSLAELSVVVSRSSLSGSADWLVGFNTGTPLSQIDGDEFSRLSISFTGNFQFLDNPSRLPSSLDEWDLLAADPTVTFSREGLDENRNYEQWTARSFTLTNLSMNEVPETSSTFLLLFGTLAFLKRHRF